MTCVNMWRSVRPIETIHFCTVGSHTHEFITFEILLHAKVVQELIENWFCLPLCNLRKSNLN